LQDDALQFIALEKIKYPYLNQFYKQVYKKGVAHRDEIAFILKDKGIICSAKLKPLSDHFLLTGVACDPIYAGKGYTSLLIKKILLLYPQPVYCFPYAHLTLFYQRLGFQIVSIDKVPEVIAKRFLIYTSKQNLLLMVYSSKSANKSW
jgi:N-acetylglutamate synthase-like GNAT family acetyltransferase